MRVLWFGGRLYLKARMRDLVGGAASEMFTGGASGSEEPAF